MIASDKKQHADELTEIHQRLVDQREFYGKDLATRLSSAHRFAEDFAELHLDLATRKMQTETWTYATQLRDENAELFLLLKEHEELEAALKKATRQNKILTATSRNVERRSRRLQTSVDNGEREMQTCRAREIAVELEGDVDQRLDDLRKKLQAERESNISLKKHVAVLTAKMAAIQEETLERNGKGGALLSAMKDASVFVLTRLQAIFGEPREDGKRLKLSPFNRVMQILASLPRKTQTRAVPIVEKVDAEVQTEKIESSLKATRLHEPGNASKNSVSPRRRALGQSTRATAWGKVLDQIAKAGEKRPLRIARSLHRS
jgi:chromosome segregation ATPase